jgi:hypothetical protein
MDLLEIGLVLKTSGHGLEENQILDRQNRDLQLVELNCLATRERRPEILGIRQQKIDDHFLMVADPSNTPNRDAAKGHRSRMNNC